MTERKHNPTEKRPVPASVPAKDEHAAPTGWSPVSWRQGKKDRKQG